MAKINKLILLTILCNALIIVGAGHGVIPLFFAEIAYLVASVSKDLSFKITGSYEDRLAIAALFAFGGQIIMAIACFLKRPKKMYILYVGLAVLGFSFILLVYDFLTDELSGFSLLLGTPFIYAFIRMIVFIIKTREKAEKGELIENE